MRFDIITIFPEAFSYLDSSMIKRAQEKRFIKIKLHDLRKFAKDNHRTVDAKPYGGGPGMVLKIEPLTRALGSILGIGNRESGTMQKTMVVLFSAGGKQFTQKTAASLAEKYERIVMIAGHYEGVDERVKSIIRNSKSIIQELSIGPYVLTGGELPAMVLIDAVSRHIPGVLGKSDSLEELRYGIGLPVYTRPDIFEYRGKKYKVPGVLLSGDHKKIDEWRRRKTSR